MRPAIEKDDHESKVPDEDVKVTFGWKNISYSIPTNDGTKDILQNVSGFLQSGTSPVSVLLFNYLQWNQIDCYQGSYWQFLVRLDAGSLPFSIFSPED
jgi:hypothetical protein